MFRTFRFFAYPISYLIRKINRFKNIEKHSNGENKKEIYREIDVVTEHVCKNMLKIAGAKVQVSGLENINSQETYLFVSNHQSNLDIPILYAYLPIKTAFVAKEELGNLPLLGKVMKLRGCIFLNREDNRDAIKSIQKGIEFLKDGNSLTVFPEGTRSKGNQMLEFKPGALRLATKSNTKIVPVSINGSYKVMEANNGKIKPADVFLTFGEPVEPNKFKDAVELANYLKTKIKMHLS